MTRYPLIHAALSLGLLCWLTLPHLLSTKTILASVAESLSASYAPFPPYMSTVEDEEDEGELDPDPETTP